MKAIYKLLIIFGFVVFIACGGKDQQQAIQKPQQTAVPVVTKKVEKKDMPVQLQAVGTVEAVSSVQVKPQVQGVLLTVNFKEGQDVNKGDLLFTIDPKPLQAKLAEAKANLAKDLAQATTARQQAARYESLVKKDYVTKEQFDQVRTNAEALEATAEADRAAVQDAELQLGYTTIRSPITGRTGNLMVHPGNVLKENETVLVEIHQMDPIYVSFSVPEQFLHDINKYRAETGLKVIVTDKSGNNPVGGTLNFVNNEVDHSTGTIQLKGVFDNKQSVLWPGEFTNITLTLTTRPNSIVVPAEAVESGQDGQFVFVVKQDMTAEVRPITVGATVGQETIVEKGLQPGETVVTDGQLRLLPGAKVELKTSTEKAS
jgi:membrane fusion protein, multidrug efflux system